MNEEEDMTVEIVGGNVFEFSTEIANLEGTKSRFGGFGAGALVRNLMFVCCFE